MDRVFIDQMGRKVGVPPAPQRIVSLVPSQTELLFDLGLKAEVIGRTRFCIHPADKVDAVQIIGGTKKFRFDVIDALEPDLIIGNKEENYEEGIAKLAESYPVWMSDVITLADALGMIRTVGQMVEKGARAEALAAEIERRFVELPRLERPLRVAYFIWQKPFMVVGGNTFINDMLARCGFVNAFAGESFGRYPEVSAEQVRAAELDAILLSSEPFPFGEKHRAAIRKQFPESAVYLVDGEMFSWYGSRLVAAVAYLQAFMAKMAVI